MKSLKGLITTVATLLAGATGPFAPVVEPAIAALITPKGTNTAVSAPSIPGEPQPVDSAGVLIPAPSAFATLIEPVEQLAAAYLVEHSAALSKSLVANPTLSGLLQKKLDITLSATQVDNDILAALGDGLKVLGNAAPLVAPEVDALAGDLANGEQPPVA